jgi:hypothetical protein
MGQQSIVQLLDIRELFLMQESVEVANGKQGPTTSLSRVFQHLKRMLNDPVNVVASAHNPEDYAGALRTSGFSRSAGSPQEGRANGASGGILRETEGAERYHNSVEARVSLALGVRGARNQACRN